MLGVAEEQLPPFGLFRPSLERPAVEQRPAIQIVVDLAGQDEAVDERGVEKQLLEPLERTEPDQVAAAEPHQVLADVKMPVLLRHFRVADDLDVARVADAQLVFVRQPDVVESTSDRTPSSSPTPHRSPPGRLEASITFLTTGYIVRGPGPFPAVVPSMIANRPGWISFWMASRSTSVS